MKTFKIGFSYTVYGTATHVEAETKEQAEEWLYNELERNGLDEIEYKTNDREYHVQDAEEINHA